MQIRLVILLFLLLFGCIYKSSLKPIIPYHVINAHSAKVWILQKRIVNGIDQAPQLRERKRTFTFFDDFQLMEQQMVHLGSNIGLRATYSMGLNPSANDTLFNIYYTDHPTKLKFKVKEISYKTLMLEAVTGDTIREEWHLIPLNKSN